MKKLVAVTACPTGIAHTFMAAEALQQAAKEMGVEIKVETQGSVGAQNVITAHEVDAAHAVIIAANTKVDRARFTALPVVEAGVQDAIRDAKALIERALAADGKKRDLVEEVQARKAEQKEKLGGVYKHLMTGVSHMIPFVVAGGILIALSFAFGIEAFKKEGTFAAALMQIGGGSAFALMIPVLAGFIAFSIADRPGLAPGMVGGILANQVGAGFLGGLIAGFLAGYTVEFLKKNIRLPRTMEGLMPVLVLPVLGSFVVGMLMVYVVGKPVAGINAGLSSWLSGLGQGNALLLGTVLGLMMAFDMGGPVNKAAYTFGVSTLAAGQPSMVMAAVMAAGMTPPLGIALATFIAPKKFTTEEHEAGKAAFFLGVSFITEGPFPSPPPTPCA